MNHTNLYIPQNYLAPQVQVPTPGPLAFAGSSTKLCLNKVSNAEGSHMSSGSTNVHSFAREGTTVNTGHMMSNQVALHAIQRGVRIGLPHPKSEQATMFHN